MIWFLLTACLVATTLAGLRWLRVAQREHYLAGSVSRFAVRWWAGSGLINLVLGIVVLVGVVASTVGLGIWSALIVAAIVAAGPIGLSVRGTSSPLAWTPRLLRLAVLSGSLLAGLLLVAALTFENPTLMVLALVSVPLLVDISLGALRPIERILGEKWVVKAGRKLAAIRPEVVAITGSYGKTTTKGYVTHLLAGTRRVVPTPASFNNRMGLARAINEGLNPGTQVFVAEMGTYGRGEIADLCSWVTPKVAAIVSIGPVHLERFKTEENILLAKSEILDRASVGVLCVDHPLLARLAGERAASMEIVEVGTGDRGRVVVKEGSVVLDGEVIGMAPAGVYPANLAVAVGIGVALGLDIAALAERFSDLPRAEHRLTGSVSASGGFTIIDDTFNANPAGVRKALDTLVATGASRKVLVTPGMVELGRIQGRENEKFAAEAAALVEDLVIVGSTNRTALELGSAQGQASVTVFQRREDAVAWVRENLGPGDAVLYENDLPDHYP